MLRRLLRSSSPLLRSLSSFPTSADLSEPEFLIFVNGDRFASDQLPSPETKLSAFLRDNFFKSVKVSCDTGICGSCAVVIQDLVDESVLPESSESPHLRYRSVNSCAVPLFLANGKHILTTEWMLEPTVSRQIIGDSKKVPSDLLVELGDRLVGSNAIQCGYCTPGLMMNLYAFYLNLGLPGDTVDDVLNEECRSGMWLDAHLSHITNMLLEQEELLNGNQCRCTGYRPIVESLAALVCGDQHNTHQHTAVSEEFLQLVKKERGVLRGAFPPELQGFRPPSRLHLENGGIFKWPESQEELIQMIQHEEETVAVALSASGMESMVFGSEAQKGFPRRRAEASSEVLKESLLARPRDMLNLGRVKEFRGMRLLDTNELFVGSSVSLQELYVFCRREMRRDDPEVWFLKHVARCLRRIASQQVRTTATVGGNLLFERSELALILQVAGGNVELIERASGATIEMEIRSFFDYVRDLRRFGNESASSAYIIRGIRIPLLRQDELVFKYQKVSRRHMMDQPLMASAMSYQEGTYDLVFGEMLIDHDWFVAERTASFLSECEILDSEAIEEAGRILQYEMMNLAAEGILLLDGISEYRKQACIGILKKFLRKTQDRRFAQVETDGRTDTMLRPLLKHKRQPLQTTIQYENETSCIGPDGSRCGCKDHEHAPVEGNIYGHVLSTGEAAFVDDIPRLADELSVCVVTSEVAHGLIRGMDLSVASDAPGVRAIIFHEHIEKLGGSNTFGSASQGTSDDIFAKGEVRCIGQPIVAVVAETYEQAKTAAALVEMDIEELPAIFTIDEAIENESYFPFYPQLKKGDVVEGLDRAKQVLEGEFEIGGQQHGYGELHCSIAIPRENEEIEIFAASQSLFGIQKYASRALNVPYHKIRVATKRLGGAYGGKQTRASILAVINAVCAKCLQLPTRLQLERTQDMEITGGRHPYKSKYKVAFDPETGKIDTLLVDIYSNAGASNDLSLAIMDKAILNLNQVYDIPNIVINARCCFTNILSPTAFRGFGAPQTQLIMEEIVESVADALPSLSVDQIRSINLAKGGTELPYGIVLDEQVSLPKLWDRLKETSCYAVRLQDIEVFNEENKYKKRGIHMMPAGVGMGMCNAPFYNVGAALAHVYADGSVLVSTGGVEMGQGLQTKVAQVAARSLECPLSSVHVVETATDKTANSPNTAASLGTDVFCGATADACSKIFSRLRPMAEKMGYPESCSWEELVDKAYLDQVDLSDHGFTTLYPISGLEWSREPIEDWRTSPRLTGDPFPYIIYCAVVTEVEVDCLTGEHQLLRVDIVEDCGKSFNPLIDIGQIEGAFVQGYGWVTMEEVRTGNYSTKEWLTPGKIDAISFQDYKIPLAHDIPPEFHIEILENEYCPTGFWGSKTAGEPPFFLGASAFFAIRNAIKDFRQREQKQDEQFVFNTPATVMNILQACQQD